MIASQPRLGARLRRHREKIHLGIRLAAKHAGINKGLLSRIERGQDVQLSTLRKILGAYGLKITVPGL